MYLNFSVIYKRVAQVVSSYHRVIVGRDCRTRLARPNSQARTRTGKKNILPVQLTTCRIGNLTGLIHALAICVTIHTYIVSDATMLPRNAKG